MLLIERSHFDIDQRCLRDDWPNIGSAHQILYVRHCRRILQAAQQVEEWHCNVYIGENTVLYLACLALVDILTTAH